MRCIKRWFPFGSTLLAFAVLLGAATRRAEGVVYEATSQYDNTLYEHDPRDPGSPLNSNGSGNFLSAGRSFSLSLLRRGLIQFDFA